MSRFTAQFLRRFLREQLGQQAVVVAVTITAITAVAATSVEVGHVYYAYQQLVDSTNQAALAGAQAMSNALTSTASTGAYTAAVTSAVKQYSSVAGQLNATSYLQSDAIATQTLFCSTVMEASPFDVVCQSPPGSTTGYNAIKVVQTATVPLWFGGLVGMPSMNLAATATASMKGAANTPYNLAVIMDTTNSMSDTIKGDSNCTKSQISCAVAGLESMLNQLDPCQLNTTCTSATPYVDNVALFVFPALSVNNKAKNYQSDYCGSGAATVPYNFINVTPGWVDPLTNLKDGLDMEASTSIPNSNAGAYGIIPFNTAYKTNDGAALSLSSALAEAVAVTGTGCAGLSAPGGQETYYAQVIYTAQEALVTQQASNPTSKNIMIILSDGDATACASNANTAAGACNSAAQIVADNNPTCALAVKTAGNCLNGTGTSTTNPNATTNGVSTGYQSYTYPSALGECGQAVQAAQKATAAGTMVYTIGFGSETSGCASDRTFTANLSSADGAEAWPGGSHPSTPCNAIAAMASNPNTFYSDDSGGCPALSSANKDFTSLVGIFDAITTGLTSPRLIPNGTN
jgi:Flp pilus assembly protein TadG